jgi:hypothetical protein
MKLNTVLTIVIFSLLGFTLADINIPASGNSLPKDFQPAPPLAKGGHGPETPPDRTMKIELFIQRKRRVQICLRNRKLLFCPKPKARICQRNRKLLIYRERNSGFAQEIRNSFSTENQKSRSGQTIGNPSSPKSHSANRTGRCTPYEVCTYHRIKEGRPSEIF